MPKKFEQFEIPTPARPEARRGHGEQEDDVVHLTDPPYNAFDAALSATLDEWASPEDDEAFRGL